MEPGDPGGIAERLGAVRQRIDRATRAAGRDPSEVRLIAVSKTRPAADIRAAWAAGHRDFGENYVNELVAKHDALADLSGLRWHMIGHVQRNKARHVAHVASSVHSLDSPRLAAELGARSLLERRSLEVFVEVNVGDEPSKTGCAPEDLAAMLTAVELNPSLVLQGLMTVPPHTDDPEGAAPYFEALKSLRDTHGGLRRLPELSMGMTHDLEVAVAHGATVVRVGTAIFGPRG